MSLTTYDLLDSPVDTLLCNQGGARRSGSVDTPEGNGTGFVWDSDGHVITNFHVLASALRQLRPAQLQGEGSPRVAKLTLFSRSC